MMRTLALVLMARSANHYHFINNIVINKLCQKIIQTRGPFKPARRQSLNSKTATDPKTANYNLSSAHFLPIPANIRSTKANLPHISDSRLDEPSVALNKVSKFRNEQGIGNCAFSASLALPQAQISHVPSAAFTKLTYP
jgi:hypothetical protein